MNIGLYQQWMHRVDMAQSVEGLRGLRDDLADVPSSDPAHTEIAKAIWLKRQTLGVALWDEAQHPRVPSGNAHGGEFTDDDDEPLDDDQLRDAGEVLDYLTKKYGPDWLAKLKSYTSKGYGVDDLLEGAKRRALYDGQPRTDDGKFDFGKMPGTNKLHHEALAEQAEQGVHYIERLVDEAVQQADWEGLEEPLDQNKAWKMLTPDEQQKVLDAFKESQINTEYVATAGREAGETFIRGALDERAGEIESETRDELLRRFEEMHGIKLDPESIDTIRYPKTDWHTAESGTDLQQQALRTLDGHELTSTQKLDASSIFDDAHRLAVAKAETSIRESSAFEDAVTVGEHDAIVSAWNDYSPWEKYGWARRHNIVEAPRAEAGLPDEWKWQKDGEDYLKTKAIAKELVDLRTAQIMQERGLSFPKGSHFEDLDSLEGQLWESWKVSSTSDDAVAMQMAAAKEFGAVDRLDAKQRADALQRLTFIGSGDTSKAYRADWSSLTPDEQEKMAEPGLNIVRAYMRAEWETTQFLLSKTHTDMVDVYRAVYVPKDTLEMERQTSLAAGQREYYELPEITLKRNNLSSTTLDPGVANNWSGVSSTYGQDRVVLRFEVPKTMVFSVPVFGKNIEGEEEVVLLGGRTGVKWDAWLRTAPEFSEHKIAFEEQTPKQKRPLDIDLGQIEREQDQHWLRGWRQHRDPIQWLKDLKKAKRQKQAVKLADWDEAQHPRMPAGSPAGGEFTTAGGVHESAAIADFKADRPLTGPESQRIDHIIHGAKAVGYFSVPGVEVMHRAMGVSPHLRAMTPGYEEKRKVLFKKQPLQSVPFEKLVFTQGRVNRRAVEEMSSGAGADKRTGNPVFMVKSGGKYYVMNGHHRVIARYLRGKGHVNGYVFTPTDHVVMGEWDEAQHPRVPAGSPEGGEFTANGETGAGRAGLDALMATIHQPDGGFTYHAVTGEQPSDGFAVSIYKGHEAVFDVKTLTAEQLWSYAKANWDLLKQPGNYFGGWHNPEDGKLYLDVSKVVHSAAEAERLGRNAHQLAYFDLKAGQSVSIGAGLSEGYTVSLRGGLSGGPEKAGIVVDRATGGRADAGGPVRVVPSGNRARADRGGQEGRAGGLRGLHGEARGLADWDEVQHPRVPAGTPEGGEFTTVAGPAIGDREAWPEHLKQLDVPQGTRDVIEAAQAAGHELPPDAVLRSLPDREVDKLRAAIARGRAALPEFHALLKAVGAEIGAAAAESEADYINVTKDRMFEVGPLKGLARAAEKVVMKYDGNIQKLSDIVRGTVVVKDEHEARTVVAAIKKHATVMAVEDRFAAPLDSGYRDIALKVLMKNGVTAEIQVHAAEMLRAKNTEGHRIYEKLRTTPAGSSEFYNLLLQSRNLYQKAWDKVAH